MAGPRSTTSIKDCFACCFGTKTSASNPPPYEDISQFSSVDLKKPKPQPIPQWNWTTAQCRAWFSIICEEWFGYSNEQAQVLAEKFDGYGPMLFMWGQQDYVDFLGDSKGKGFMR